MEISVIDASNYFKGLLLLIRRDRNISGQEAELMKRVGKALGFEKEFCEQAIRDILGNEYIGNEIPEFSTKQVAMKFLKDGLKIANSDEGIHFSEEQWLMAMATMNGIDERWFLQERENERVSKDRHVHFEVEDLTIKHS